MYAFKHEEKGFFPDGSATIPGDSVDEHNREVERKEIEWLRSAPERVFLYVKRPEENATGAENRKTKITTFLGTVVSDQDSVSYSVRRYIGFNRWTYRRAITARIYGTLYHGWYMESSGDYCRLKRAKRQR